MLLRLLALGREQQLAEVGGAWRTVRGKLRVGDGQRRTEAATAVGGVAVKGRFRVAPMADSGVALHV